MMGLHHIAEAIARLEHKIDALLRHNNVRVDPMQFTGVPCPVCKMNIDYVIDLEHQVVTRRCDCKTGKIPPTTPLFPVPGVSNGRPFSSPTPTLNPEDSPERKAR